jgi:putative redox protein
MPTIAISYKGGLRTELTHMQSGTRLITDAPVDNNGKGESFSPTDLVAGAYVSCMLTIIGIYCEQNGLKFEHGEGSVEKIMQSGPRKIGELLINLDLSENGWEMKDCLKIERAARTCPVALSVDPNINVSIYFSF